jgi:hypothetical protein
MGGAHTISDINTHAHTHTHTYTLFLSQTHTHTYVCTFVAFTSSLSSLYTHLSCMPPPSAWQTSRQSLHSTSVFLLELMKFFFVTSCTWVIVCVCVCASSCVCAYM